MGLAIMSASRPPAHASYTAPVPLGPRRRWGSREPRVIPATVANERMRGGTVIHAGRESRGVWSRFSGPAPSSRATNTLQPRLGQAWAPEQQLEEEEDLGAGTQSSVRGEVPGSLGGDWTTRIRRECDWLHCELTPNGMQRRSCVISVQAESVHTAREK